MALNFAGLPELVRWLADKYHDGAVYPMAEKIGLSSATMDKWVKGTVKNPELESLKLMAEAYHLPLTEVIEVTTRRPSRRRRGRALACLLAALGLAWLHAADWVPVEGGTLRYALTQSAIPLIGICIYLFVRAFTTRCRQLPVIGSELSGVGVFPDLCEAVA